VAETVLGFTVETFKHVEVTLADDTVRTITVHLDQPLLPDTLIRQLKLTDVRPVNVPDDSGELLGQAFPERGVLFSLTPDGKRVAHVVLEKLDPTQFVLRAEMDLNARTRSALADLNYAISQQPKNARALWLRAKVMITAARYDEALSDVEAALVEEPNQPLYHLTHAEILGRQGNFEEAGKETKDVLTTADLSDELKAKAMCQLGDLLAASPAHDYKLAMEHHLSAVKTADPLSIDKNVTVRRAAKQILIEAHLAAANDIACGYWQQKETSVSKWIDRAQAYAEEMIAHDEGDPALRLQVARGALAACAGAQGKIDSIPWARMALQYGKPLVVAAEDPWTKLRLQWELGTALSDSLAADDLRGATQHMLANTALTITYLETGAKGRLETPEDSFRLGGLYFRQGSLYAVRMNDHKTAVAWFEKAYPLLDRPIPATRMNEQGRFGEWLVSMGISYWEIGARDFALQLTDAGMQHVEEAVNRKLIDAKALAIPYSNLASMHQALGHKEEAASFTQLAGKFEAAANPRR
jgi:tetratricopeptide (TPR) repeat protein